MIYIPLILFVGATVVLAIAVLNQTNNNRIELPVTPLNSTPTTEVLPILVPTTAPTPTVVDPSIQIKNDLDLVMQDIGKVKVEDTRFKPPEFEFEMGI